MAKELINCLNLLHEKFAGEQINRGFKQYIELAEFIARNYDDSLTRAELEDRYPWIRFMTEVEQEGLLERAKRIRRRDRRKGLAENMPGGWFCLAQNARAELTWWIQVKECMELAVFRHDLDAVEALLDILDEAYARDLVDGLAKARREAKGK